jgi:hypothetical protein
MSVSADGETTIEVRAQVSDRAPRIVPIRVKRVQHLPSQVAAYRRDATSTYAAIATDIDSKRGMRVALRGTATDIRVEKYVTVLLLDVRDGCDSSPCLARVTYGAKTELENGDSAEVFGKILGGVNGPRTGSQIPNIAADFVVHGQR